MKRTLRFVALAGALATTALLSAVPQAEAVSSCTTYANKYCSTVGARVSCVSSGQSGVCVCNSSHRWGCYF